MSAYHAWAPRERITMQSLRRWNIREFIKPTTTPWPLSIPHDDLQRLIKGYHAVDMDQKWIFLTLGPDEESIYTVKMIRSWSGCPMMAMKIRAELGEDGQPRTDREAQVFELVWETEQSVWPMDDFFGSDDKAKEWTREICSWVMEIKLPMEAEENTQ